MGSLSKNDWVLIGVLTFVILLGIWSYRKYRKQTSNDGNQAVRVPAPKAKIPSVPRIPVPVPQIKQLPRPPLNNLHIPINKPVEEKPSERLVELPAHTEKYFKVPFTFLN